jgi:ligand-binding SRPBCC domain-containing protein
MHTYERSVRVAAPFDAVWDFHSTESGLEALTPEWMNLQVESVTGPDGEPNPDVLDAGATLETSVRPFGVGPRQQWVSEIAERDRSEGTAFFRDVMAEGPFPHWEHTHLFYDDGDETLVRDRVEYELPVGPLNPVLGPLAIVGFEPMFRYRHRKTKSLLES